MKVTITLPKFTRVSLRRPRWAQVKAAWRNKWVRRVCIGLLVLGAYQTGAGNADPRMPENLPHLGTPVEYLHGKWDGIGTLPDGSTFCLTGWPCEDEILNTPGAGK